MAAVVHEPSLISLLSSMHEVQPRLGLRAIALARTSIIAIRQSMALALHFVKLDVTPAGGLAPQSEPGHPALQHAHGSVSWALVLSASRHRATLPQLIQSGCVQSIPESFRLQDVARDPHCRC